MERSFKLLRIFSVVFKVLAWVILLLMGAGMVGLLVAWKQSGANVTGPMILNMVFSGSVGFLLFYAFSETIRLLLALQEQLANKKE